MRLLRVTLAAAVLLLSADVFVTGDTPKPSDTNNQPATPVPNANTNTNNGQTPAPSATTLAPPGQTPVPGQTPAPAPKPSPSPSPTSAPTPSPTPSVSAANNNATSPQPSEAAATPGPAAANNNSSSSSSTESNGSVRSTDPSSTSASTPEATTTVPIKNQSADDSNSGGMSAGAIVGIILAVLAFVGLAGFFLYRHLRSQNADEQDGNGHGNGKHFDYPVSSPAEVTVMGQTDYSLAKMERQSSQDMPIMTGNGSILSSANNSSYASSSIQNAYNNNQNAGGAFGNNYGNGNVTGGNAVPAAASTAAANNSNASNYGNNKNVTLYNESTSSDESSSVPAFAKSTARFLNGPDAESPPFKKTDVQLSRPSTSNLDETMEFNHSFTHSFAESYAESYSSDVGYMNSFVQGMPGSEGLSVGASSAMGDALDRDTATNDDNAHWLDAMDEMRDTGDSYAMLESDSYGSERGSAIDDRFSTDSEYTSSTSRQL